MAKWIVTAKAADFNAIGSHFGIDPVVARVIRNRDICGIEDIEHFLHGGDKGFHDAGLLSDMDKAASILIKAVLDNKKIRIIGDYDVDGVTSTCILYKALNKLKARVDYCIPNRISDGYGINNNIVKSAIQDGIQVIITCDNGIAAREPLEYAKKNGITCLVTDHHDVPFEEESDIKKFIYPNVDAIVNPKCDFASYPFKSICGAFVAYKLTQVLFKKSKLEYKNYKLLDRELMELAALGTVCDVCPLIDENRTLVKNVIESFNNTTNVGLKALMEVTGQKGKVTAFSLGYVLGPCINATGRLEDATLSIELLLEYDREEALKKALKLKELNELRKEMTASGLEEALRIIDKNNIEDNKIMVVFVPELHESLAGIVAGRLRERFYRPVFVVTEGEEGLKGSGRSIDGYDMYKEMNKCKELFTKFGGHTMAAGFSMERENLEKFGSFLNENCNLSDDDLEEKIRIDVPMPMDYVSEKLIQDLELLEPYGVCNPKPCFAQKDVKFLKGRAIGNGNMGKFEISATSGKKYEAVLFNNLSGFLELVEKKYGKEKAENLMGNGSDGSIVMDVTYNPVINDYMGRKSIQFVLGKYR